MIEQVIKYQTVDGNLFNTKEEAEKHELFCEFIEYYDNDGELSYEGEYQTCSIDANDMWTWITDHWFYIYKCLKKYKDIRENVSQTKLCGPVDGIPVRDQL